MLSNFLLEEKGKSKIQKVKKFFSGKDGFLISHVKNFSIIDPKPYQLSDDFVVLVVLVVSCSDHYNANDKADIVIAITKTDFCTLTMKWNSGQYRSVGEFKDLVEIDPNDSHTIYKETKQGCNMFGILKKIQDVEV